jgi:RHS repeat-associated protein
VQTPVPSQSVRGPALAARRGRKAQESKEGKAPGGVTTAFTYDVVGNRTQKTLPNGAYTTYNYGNRNWLTSLANRKSDATLVSSYAYAHDYVGNRTAMTEANGDVSSYVYDNVYRLVSEEKRNSGNTLLWRYQYTYDGVGNRLTMNNSGVITYTYDANNKLTQLVGPSGTTTFGYDGNGNTTSMVTPGPVTTTYGYDYENQLTSVTAPTYTAGYTYSADGLRLRAQESNNPYPDRWMQYDGVRPVLEGTLSGDTFTTLNRYVLEGASYYDPLISASIGGSNWYYLYDGLGSTRQLLDSSQNVTDTYAYEAFGNVMASTGSTPNPYKYVGSLGYYATGSSLQHLGARYYLPEVGRFMSQDPLGIGHPYSYCDSHPLVFVDPHGLESYFWADLGESGRALGHMLNPFEIRDIWGGGFRQGSDSGYYSCYSDCMLKGGLVKYAEEQFLPNNGPMLAARAYYTITDGRFTDWGRQAYVMVPRLAERIAPYAEGLSGAGWLALGTESLNCMRECSCHLTGG